MNNRHKYLRNLRYKQKLETQYNNRGYAGSNVYFITKEPDPRYERERYFRFSGVDDKKHGGAFCSFEKFFQIFSILSKRYCQFFYKY